MWVSPMLEFGYIPQKSVVHLVVVISKLSFMSTMNNVLK